MKRPDLVERIIRIQHHESGTFDHGELGDRDMGLVAGKLGDRFGGLATLAATHRALTKQLSQGDEARATTLLEDLQQTTLSICGACISLLDEYLMVVRHRSQIPASLQQMSRIALSYSSNAYDMLSDLAARFPDTRLPDARLADHQHISWYGWIQTALQNRLRAMIDVATARRARLMPSVKRGLGSALDASLPTIRAHYLELLTLSPSTSTTRTALGMQGTWLALLDSGRLPQPPTIGPLPSCWTSGSSTASRWNWANPRTGTTIAATTERWAGSARPRSRGARSSRPAACPTARGGTTCAQPSRDLARPAGLAGRTPWAGL
ncbi:hypothetical protein GCM10025881_02000 [Pseudolysinimonas kribbensis]|uniref:Phosphoenolpyruvate carboxylase n=1 Tax=Pseudolysinimonas kribbensis TaxID=433641 RepID=A0ABQ6K0R7_9MICO|nr:hypothetical protein GCM10025881_02000 [Pseudolysinimonas kribbensis]